MSIFVAADISVTGAGEGRRRSTDWDRLGRNDGVLFELEAELESNGDGYRLLVFREEEEDEEEVVVVVVVVVEEEREWEGEGDK